MKKLMIAAGIMAISFSSCIFSLHPLYTEDTKLFREDILGKWWQKEDGQEWTFERMEQDPKGYRLTHVEDGKANQYDAYLIRLGDHLFLDLKPVMPQKAEEELGNLAFFLPTHNFFKIDITGKEQMTVRFFDGEHLDELFEQRRIRIKHEKVEESYVLTASSEELQKFFLKYAEDDKAFSEYEQQLVRK
jgi:hypothetical protein